jgi:hypothetical protein
MDFQVSWKFGKWGHFWENFDHSSLWGMGSFPPPWRSVRIWGKFCAFSDYAQVCKSVYPPILQLYAYFLGPFLLSRPLGPPKLSPLVGCSASLHWFQWSPNLADVEFDPMGLSILRRRISFTSPPKCRGIYECLFPGFRNLSFIYWRISIGRLNMGLDSWDRSATGASSGRLKSEI